MSARTSRTGSPAPSSAAAGLQYKNFMQLETLAISLGASQVDIQKHKKAQDKPAMIRLITDLQQGKHVPSKSFFQKYIAPNVFNFYPVATVCALLHFGSKNAWDYGKTMTNGGDWVVFLLCVKVFLIHNGIAHLTMVNIIHKSQGLTVTPGSKMFENELGAQCLCMGIFAILAGSGGPVALCAKTNGAFCFYAGVRHVLNKQPAGTFIPGMLTGILLLAAGFHAQPLDLTRIY